ncbi:MAG: hypothetical protein ACKOF3_03605 [Spartobacteria bacterium]
MAWKRRVLILLCAVALATAVCAAPLATGSSSRSGAFIAYSQDRELRNKMLRAAEGALGEWEKIHETKAGSAAPIVLNDKTHAVMPKGGEPVVPLLFETEAGMKVQVDLYDEGAMESGSFEAGLFSALALHAMHGGNAPRAGKAFDLPPRWFVEGLVEELRRSRHGTPDGVYAALIQSGRPPDLEAFFRQKPEILDAVSVVLYRAQAVSLLRVLQKAQDSKKSFAALVVDPSFSRGRVEPVLAAFPSLGSQSALSKLWTLNIARSSMPPCMASLTVEQSERELTDVLKSVKGGQDLPEAAKAQGGAFLMREFAVRIFNLEFRSHPLFQPVLEEYRNIATQLARRPKARVAEKIRELQVTRAQLVERSQKISDYLNWFEVTQIDEPQSFREGKSGLSGSIPYKNPYALYLDSLEARGW